MAKSGTHVLWKQGPTATAFFHSVSSGMQAIQCLCPEKLASIVQKYGVPEINFATARQVVASKLLELEDLEQDVMENLEG